MMRSLILLALLPLAACAGQSVVKTEVKTVQVKVRAACPDAATYEALVASQPVPLRRQPMPATAEERVARSSAQLGHYEAEGAWVDQVRAALDSCHAAGD